MRRQVQRQRREILDLQRAGIPTKSAEELLGWMLTKVDRLIGDRNRLVGERRVKYPDTDKIINGPIERRFPIVAFPTQERISPEVIYRLELWSPQ
jgi:hypothetical protein